MWWGGRPALENAIVRRFLELGRGRGGLVL